MMSSIQVIRLLRNYDQGNTVRMNMKDGSSYVGNCTNYERKDFIEFLDRIDNYEVIWQNM